MRLNEVMGACNLPDGAYDWEELEELAGLGGDPQWYRQDQAADARTMLAALERAQHARPAGAYEDTNIGIMVANGLWCLADASKRGEV